MSYPASLWIEHPAHVARWRPFVQWLLALPHFLIASALGYVAAPLAVVSWFLIVLTGRLPDGIAQFQVMALRYSVRTNSYAGFLHAEYPPIEFAMTTQDPADTPVGVSVLPALEQRNRLTVGLRAILMIPAALYTMLVGFLGAVCWGIGFFAVVITGRWPAGLASWVERSQLVSVRFAAYATLLTDQYPPFSTR